MVEIFRECSFLTTATAVFRIICPNCKTEIKFTECLAAPLIEFTRRQYQKQLARKDADIAKRDAAFWDQVDAFYGRVSAPSRD